MDEKELRELIKGLSPDRRDQLMTRLAAAGRLQARDAGPVPLSRGEGVPVPLSFAQERGWFRAMRFPGIAHNICGALRLNGWLSEAALSASLNAIVRRHETLRATFRSEEGTPVQTIRPWAPLPIERIDLSSLEPATRESEWRRRYAGESLRDFDLASDWMLRVTLIRMAEDEHVLLMTMHHIVSDGWSVGVLMRELAELYTAFEQSRTPVLPALPIQYCDFAVWQRKRAEDGGLEPGRTYWKKQLEDLPPVLELSPDRLTHSAATSDQRDHEAAASRSRISPPLRRALEALSRQEEATLFVTLLTAFMTLLMRCTEREDLVIGCPVSGRFRAETEPLVGLFLNTIALRVSLSPALTFRDAMAAVRKHVLEGLEHVEVPIQQVLQGSGHQRSGTSTPLYETVFNYTPEVPRRMELPGLEARLEDAPTGTEEFSTQLFVTDCEGALELDLRYRRQLYSDARMGCFLEQYLAILEQAARNPEATLGSLDLVTPLSRALLPDPSIPLAMPLAGPELKQVTHSISWWAEQAPSQPAISRGASIMTYETLAARMIDVSNALRARGLRPGQVVAVVGARAHGIVVAMAGLLEAGGVLLTLSPDLPAQRQHLMLAGADARFLVHGGPWRAQDEWLRALPGLTILEVDPDGIPAPACGSTAASATFDLEAAHPAPDSSASRQPAYVFFTSGSTGTPRGVLGTHAGLAHWLEWQRATFEIGPGDRCSQLTGLSFDVVLRDIFLPLTSGATLVLPEDDVASGDGTLSWLDRERITVIHTVPTVAETWLLNTSWKGSLSLLRRIFFAGEPLTAALVVRWRERFPLAGEIVNLYGPTETTLAKCYYRVPSSPRAGVQPLGRPLPQTQALVLRPDRTMCAVGEPGEIALRTPFRSLGYIGMPEENEKRFVPNPFARDPDDLLYLTGDKGVYGADGLLGFRGRIDHQVKVRGVRVEPMEVSVALQSSPDVGACAVVVRDDLPGGPALVAYVILRAGVQEDIGALRAFLARRLPAAMIPSAFVFLSRLPMTANHKLDREKLPSPSEDRSPREGQRIAPRNGLEAELAHIWEGLLNVRPIGVTDSFFELGGHSLLGIRMLVLVEQRLGFRVPLTTLFEEATIQHLAATLKRSTSEWPLLVPLKAGDQPQKLFLVHSGGGLLWNYLHLVRHLTPGLPIFGLQARGIDGLDAPHDRLEPLAADYIAAMRRVQPRGPYILAGHSLGGMIAFEMARQLQEQGEEVDLLAMLDTASPAALEGIDDPEPPDDPGLLDMALAMERFLGPESILEPERFLGPERFPGRESGPDSEQLTRLAPPELLRHIAGLLERNDVVPEGGGLELTRNLVRVSNAHRRASRSYRPGPAPVSITLIRALEGKERSEDASGDASLGWSAFSSLPVRVLWAPGDHVTLMREPNAGSVARILQACLSEVIPA